jgi:hypothetical protein
MFGALIEEEAGLTPEWSANLPQTYEQLKYENAGPGGLLRLLTSKSDQRRKLQCVRKALWTETKQWMETREMLSHRKDFENVFYWSMEMQDHLEDFLEETKPEQLR